MAFVSFRLLAQNVSVNSTAKETTPLTIPTASSTNEYKAQVISTNFTVQIIGFNIIDKNWQEAPTDRKENVTFYNSIVAGIGY